ncbi:MAG: CCA tRNA nucleotidyltransferase [Pelagibacterales bacterium]|nr:CCA tRNA nucleotidyltransferase [Pelagibacterales bacterium]
MSEKQIYYPHLVDQLPSSVIKIFDIFSQSNDSIRLVGGCVRDLLLEIEVSDFDFATKLLPNQILEILKENGVKAIPTGIEFGTITAVIDGRNFEITTLRKESETNGRHFKAEFIDDYFVDASRRDFTINALYLDKKGVVYDYFDGILDIQNKKVRFIGNAEERIEEDYLRILRFFRFSSRYASEIDEVGFLACISSKKNLSKLSRERIRSEFIKLILAPQKYLVIEILEKMQQQLITKHLFSCEIDIDSLKEILKIEEKLGIFLNQKLKIAVLFLNTVDDWKLFFKEISATNLEKKYFQLLKILLQDDQQLDKKSLKRLLVFNQKELVLDYYIFRQTKENQNTEDINSNISFIKNFELPEFPLNGEDIKNIGYVGKDIGNAICLAKEAWIESNFSFGKKDLLQVLSQKSGINSD